MRSFAPRLLLATLVCSPVAYAQTVETTATAQSSAPAEATPPGVVATSPAPTVAEPVAPSPAGTGESVATTPPKPTPPSVEVVVSTAPSAMPMSPPTTPLLPAAPEPEPQAPSETITKAEFGKGIVVGTADEAFTLNIRARMQFQAMYYDAHDDTAEDITQMQIRRARVVLQGNVYGSKLTYYFQLAFSNRDNESDVRLPLRDAYFTYEPHKSANLRFGQMKVPYGRQRVVSSSAQGMVDRSIVTTELNLDRDVGVQMFSKDLFGLGETFGYAVGIFGGDGRNRLATNAGYLYVGRLSVTPFGSFDEFVEADIGRESKPRLSIAAGAAYNQATNRPQSTIGTPYADPTVFFDYTHFGADFMFKWNGFFATGEWMLRKAKDPMVSVVDDAGEATDFYAREAWGAYAQVGQMLTSGLEVSARYGHLNPLRETDPKLHLTHELGGGLAYYFEQHNLKVQSDYFYYSKDKSLKDGDHQIRVQTQLFF